MKSLYSFEKMPLRQCTHKPWSPQTKLPSVKPQGYSDQIAIRLHRQTILQEIQTKYPKGYTDLVFTEVFTSYPVTEVFTRQKVTEVFTLHRITEVFTSHQVTLVFTIHQVAELFTSHQVTLVFTNSRKYSSATGYTAAVVAGNKNKQREPPVFLGASEGISEWLTRLCPRELFTREGHSPLTIGVWNNLYQSWKKWKFCNQYFVNSWFDRKFLQI